MTVFRNVLAIDTALNGCSAGIFANGQKTTLTRPMTTGQSEALVPLVQEIVQDFLLLDAIVVTRGPGAFTGIRIGLSAARSFGMALSVPVFGISSLQALALTYPDKSSDPFAVIIDTKRGDFYMQGFDPQATAISDAQLMDEDAVKNFLVKGNYKTSIGNAAAQFPGGVLYEFPDCGTLAQSFVEQGEGTFFTTDITPLYLRGADTSQSNKPQRQLVT